MSDSAIKRVGTGVLDQLIAPLSCNSFFAEYYERRYFRSEQPIALVGNLLDIDRIDEIISDSELPPFSLSMAKSGNALSSEDYTYGNGAVDRGAVLDEFRNGATIILPQLHFADGKLYSFCLALERDFGARTQTNIYLTPPDESGFDIHYDDHDVFVLQVSGAKDWEIYGDRENLPFRGESFRKGRDDPGELKDQFTLHPGECLYVPRGTAHRAATHGDESSLHITVGILVQTWADFLLEAVAEASLRIPEMRHSLPSGLFFEPGERVAHKAQFAKLMTGVTGGVSFDTTLAAFAGNFVREQGPRVRGGLNTLSRGIGDNDQLKVRESILYSFGAEGGEQQISLAGSSIPLSDELAALLLDKLDSGAFAKVDFAVSDSEELTDVIGSLVAYGLLVRA